MLILTRRVGEALHIGEQVVVKVLSVRGGQVRLGIDAPREIKVNRDEVVNPRSKRHENPPVAEQKLEPSSADAPASAESVTAVVEGAAEESDALTEPEVVVDAADTAEEIAEAPASSEQPEEKQKTDEDPA